MATRREPKTIADQALQDIPQDLHAVGVLPDRQLAAFNHDPELTRDLEREDELAAVLSEFGDSGEVGAITIRRKNESTGKFEWLDRVSTSEFKSANGVQYIANKFGGGEYECIIYDSSGQIFKRPKTIIGKDVRPKPDVSAPAGDSTAIVRIAETMQEGFKQLGAMLAQTLKAPSEEQLLQRMLLYKQVFGAGNGERNHLSDLRAMAEFFKELQPREGETGMADLAIKFLEKFGDPIAKTVGAQLSANSPPVRVSSQQTTVPVVSAVPAITGAATVPQVSNEEMFQQQVIKYYLGNIILQAENNASPEVAARLLIQNVPPALMDSWIDNPALLDELAKYDERVKLHADWFAQVRQKILDLAYEDESAPDTPIED